MAAEFTGLGIHIKVKDIVKSREFYEGLGFVPVFGYGDDAFRATLPKDCASAPERYRGVTYNLSDSSQLEIADGHIAVKPEDFDVKVHTAKISGMVRVESLLPLVDKLKPHMHYPVKKYYWGTIEIAVRDPDGVVLVFIAPHSDEEYRALSKRVGEIEVVEPGK